MKQVYQRYFKRGFDFILSLFLIVLLSPIMIVIALLVRLRFGSHIIFKQQRPGKNEKPFMIYKFRTMSYDKKENGELLSDDKRLTRFGKALRETSLDELPELFNVLIGDMSFIGPRPLLCHYINLYSEGQRKRHDVRPGISGLAQISGRNLLSWDEKFKLDLEYVENISFRLDLKIMLLTLFSVVKREGIHSEKSVTMEPFEGNSHKV